MDEIETGGVVGEGVGDGRVTFEGVDGVGKSVLLNGGRGDWPVVGGGGEG